ncbi:hypothetical protein RSPO_c01869 [Ralstonia solanacearum Po82]|uniref:Uncharacterized protein n=1 Tax=Ralstonia solanacearum (strain Po82) TaxID=1031711 RepID=F6G1N5_RALS8|nr:hypothetical protein RSPO_c01869 [Ralstonia solanacearum Po82]
MLGQEAGPESARSPPGQDFGPRGALLDDGRHFLDACISVFGDRIWVCPNCTS